MWLMIKEVMNNASYFNYVGSVRFPYGYYGLTFFILRRVWRATAFLVTMTASKQRSLHSNMLSRFNYSSSIKLNDIATPY